MAAPQAAYLGKKSGNVKLDEAVFGESFHEPLVHRAVTAELNARRRGTASTLTRGQVAMTGAKAWRQKGTGRARAGALSTPHRTGGGVAFGPKPRGYTVKVNRKERRRALRSALSVHAARGSLAAVDADAFSEPSAKQAAEAIEGFGERGRTLVVLVEGEEMAALSFRNLASVTVLRAPDVGVADVIGAARLVASPAGFEELARLAAAPTARVAGDSGQSDEESS
jgi:large subunit ribosomal protein L4